MTYISTVVDMKDNNNKESSSSLVYLPYLLFLLCLSHLSHLIYQIDSVFLSVDVLGDQVNHLDIQHNLEVVV